MPCLLFTAIRFAGIVAVLSLEQGSWRSDCSSCLVVAHHFYFEMTGHPAGSAGNITAQRIYRELIDNEMLGARAYLTARL